MPVIRDRDLILEGLNQVLASPWHPSGKMYYGIDNFTDVNWEGIPLIMADSRTHLTWQKYLETPEKELKSKNARVIGHVRYAYPYDYTAQHLNASATIFDEEANKLIDDGLLGISTDFVCNYKSGVWDGEEIGELSGKITPQYIHCWIKQVQNEQNDIVARFMNSNGGETMTDATIGETKTIDKLETALSKFVEVFTRFFDSNPQTEQYRHTNSAPPVEQAMIPETVKMTELPDVEAIKTEYETRMASIESEKAELAAKAEALASQIADRDAADIAAKQQELETQWSTTIMPKFLPATFHEEGKEDEMKKLYLESPHEFIVKYGDFMNRTVIDAQHQNSAGVQHQNSTEKPEETVTIGSYDARTGGWI